MGSALIVPIFKVQISFSCSACINLQSKRYKWITPRNTSYDCSQSVHKCSNWGSQTPYPNMQHVHSKPLSFSGNVFQTFPPAANMSHGRLSKVHVLNVLPDLGVLNPCMHTSPVGNHGLIGGLTQNLMYLDMGSETIDLKCCDLRIDRKNWPHVMFIPTVLCELNVWNNPRIQNQYHHSPVF